MPFYFCLFQTTFRSCTTITSSNPRILFGNMSLIHNHNFPNLIGKRYMMSVSVGGCFLRFGCYTSVEYNSGEDLQKGKSVSSFNSFFQTKSRTDNEILDLRRSFTIATLNLMEYCRDSAITAVSNTICRNETLLNLPTNTKIFRTIEVYNKYNHSDIFFNAENKAFVCQL